MRKIYQREIRHIVANHSLRNKSTAYCFRSKSIVFRLILKLIKYNWIECENIKGPFLFVRPSEKLIKIYEVVEINDKIFVGQSSNSYLNRNASTNNSHCISTEIAAA